MADNQSQSNKLDAEEQRRILELELVRIRNEASAARLEARAAELELMIRQLNDPDVAKRDSLTQSGTPINPPHLPSPAETQFAFADWREVREVSPLLAAANVGGDSATITRVDAGESIPRRPHFVDARESNESSDTVVTRPEEQSHSFDRPETDAEHGTDPIQDFALLASDDESQRQEALVSGTVAVAEMDDEEAEEESRRAKPAAWLVSAIAHVAILVALALIGLQTQRPKDQVALSGSATEANEVSMETFEIESSEPETEPTEVTPSETEYEISPVGELAATEFKLDAPPAPPSPAAQSISSASSKSSAAMSLKSDSKSKIQFCGVEGGGNHFVYLVDSSGSMGEGFESARAELLASIDVLKADQRFYVVFFDADSDYMRLSDVNQDESRSVYATTENKQKLRRWAMRISMDRGKAPYDPLRFALKLKPDVIFLLSDGEFPQGIEDLLTEENKVTNLFGESYPVSIVHTIGYHSKEGESRMRRIAEKNKGQYRYVPKP